MQRFGNRKQMKQHLISRWAELPFDDTSYSSDSRYMYVVGRFNDRFGHRVTAGIQIKLNYGGRIEMDFGFPYYQLSEPDEIGLGVLDARYLCNDLGLPTFPELEYIVSKSKTDFANLDLVVAFTKAITSYLVVSNDREQELR